MDCFTGGPQPKTAEWQHTYDFHGKNGGDFSHLETAVTGESVLSDAQEAQMSKSIFTWNAPGWLA